MDVILNLWKKFPNQDLLGFAATSFFVFFVSEFIAATVSGSLSLMADAIAMSVDVATYGCNMLAERAKDRDSLTTISSKFYIEVLIPSIAIFSLFLVTVYFTTVAIEVLQTPNRGEDSINIVYLYVFAGINLIVDIVCITMFYCRGKDVFLEKREFLPQLSLDTSIHSNDNDEEEDDDMDDDEFGRLNDEIFGSDSKNSSNNNTNSNNTNKSTSATNNGITLEFSQYSNISINNATSNNSSNNNSNDYSNKKSRNKDSRYNHLNNTIDNANERKNLNMMSAFAHVGGDSLRTLSVLIAALFSTITGTSVDLCDAWGAIVVSIMIMIFMIPLAVDIGKSGRRLYHESRELLMYERLNHEEEERDGIIL